MAEVGALEIASLGLVILIGFYLMFQKLKEITNKDRPLNEVEIERVTNLVLSRESEKLKQGNAQEVIRMDKEVRRVAEDGKEIRDLVSELNQAQDTTAKAVKSSTKVSQKIANALGGGGSSELKGIYGEGRAEDDLISAGLREGKHYVKKPQLAPYVGNPKGKVPDFAIILPGEGALAIDCKTVMAKAFEAYHRIDLEEDQAEINQLLEEHAQAVWTHVCTLAERNYPLGLEKVYGKGPDYTLLYIPSEQFYLRALRGVSKGLRKSMGYDTLREAAIRRKVFLCSPDTMVIKAIDTMDLWTSVSRIEELNDVLEASERLADAVVISEDSKARHHSALKKAVDSWDLYVKDTESTHGRRETPSLRVAITSLFEKVHSKLKHKKGRGMTGRPMEPQPLEELSVSPLEPTKTNIRDMHISARLEEAYVEEEE